MEFIGFWLPSRTRPQDPPVGQVAYEQDVAEIFGILVVRMVAARATRAISLLRGWPSRFTKCCKDEETASRTIQALKDDWDYFNRLLIVASLGNQRAIDVANRSVFKLMPVRQLVEAVKQSSAGPWTMSPSIQEWLLRRTRRMMGSLICEDAFNAQKNSNVVKSRRRYMGPQKATLIIVQSKVCPAPLTH